MGLNNVKKNTLRFVLFYLAVLMVKYSIVNNIMSSITNYLGQFTLNRAYSFTFVIISMPNFVFYFIVGFLIAKLLGQKLWLIPPILIEFLLFIYRMNNTNFYQPDLFDYILVVFPIIIIPLAMYIGAYFFTKCQEKE